MKHLFTLILIGQVALSVQAQGELKITSIEMINLGDGRLFAREKKDETALNGRIRIITGRTTEYIDAGFTEGYADGKWEYYRHNTLSEKMNYSKL